MFMPELPPRTRWQKVKAWWFWRTFLCRDKFRKVTIPMFKRDFPETDILEILTSNTLKTIYRRLYERPKYIRTSSAKGPNVV